MKDTTIKKDVVKLSDEEKQKLVRELLEINKEVVKKNRHVG